MKIALAVVGLLAVLTLSVYAQSRNCYSTCTYNPYTKTQHCTYHCY